MTCPNPNQKGVPYLLITAVIFTTNILPAHCRTINVGTTAELQSALKAVLPGDQILLGDTEFYGFFRAQVSGTKENPIELVGSRKSILSSWSSAFNLEASWYIFRGK